MNNYNELERLMKLKAEELEKELKYRDNAKELHAMYKTYCKVGFTEQQAFELVKVGLYSATFATLGK